MIASCVPAGTVMFCADGFCPPTPSMTALPDCEIVTVGLAHLVDRTDLARFAVGRARHARYDPRRGRARAEPTRARSLVSTGLPSTRPHRRAAGSCTP